MMVMMIAETETGVWRKRGQIRYRGRKACSCGAQDWRPDCWGGWWSRHAQEETRRLVSAWISWNLEYERHFFCDTEMHHLRSTSRLLYYLIREIKLVAKCTLQKRSHTPFMLYMDYAYIKRYVYLSICITKLTKLILCVLFLLCQYVSTV